MKIALNWLNDSIDLNKIKEEYNLKTKAELATFLADKLTGVGFEVEEIIDLAKHLNHVVVGKIEKIEKHPEADRLFVCKVNVGDKFVQIITSATNVKEGDLVPVSLDGADLANGIKIKPSKMRGVLSEGMFCSGEELGITDHLYEGAEINGILIFKDDFKAGMPVSQALMLDDYVLDVAITANRPDCMSVLGIAREVSAIFGIPVKEDDLSYNCSKFDVKDCIKVKIEDFDLCPRYMATCVKDLKVEKSPLWIRARLFSVGIHAINNIVDITNYVLIEYGQPMHAFDRDYLEGGEIIVRRAKNNEEIAVLNGNSYKLNSSNLVIADAKKPCVIAGVIGGLNSCITDNTKTTIFEAAVFERAQIRKTSRAFGVRTDSSARFEKGVDLKSPELGMKKALHLVSNLGYGKIASGIVDVKNCDVQDKKVVVSKEKIDKILGVTVKTADITKILTGLGLKVTINGDVISLLVPPYRSDIENANDVAEEIIRMYGYDIYNDIDMPLFQNITITPGKNNDILSMQRKFKEFLITRNFNEILSYSLITADAVNKLQLNSGMETNPIKLANPISEELGTLRTTMAHSLFNNVAYNIKRNNQNFKIMESGRIYIADSLPLTCQPQEKDVFAFASVCEEDNFQTFKGYLEVLLKDYNLKTTFDYSSRPYLHPGMSMDLFGENGELIASIGRINPVVAKNYEIPEKTMYGEIYCNELNKYTEKQFVVKRVSKFPIVERDLALVAAEEVTVKEIQTIIEQSMGKNFYSCKLFDIYRGKNMDNKKSLAFNLKFSSDEKTLTDEEINNSINKILKRLKENLNVVLRD